MVLNYLELRKRTQDRDKSLREKVMSLEEATKFVSDGNHIALGGSTASRTSFALCSLSAFLTCFNCFLENRFLVLIKTSFLIYYTI